ncbi:hypothetical protein L2Y96_12855 [Luteibacter aegosomaticola]|uniref:hypothetical protein n=1 Tax=Luteibacter aegosomaticola TaxID=2911538 RepID=UPI001FF71DCF|nr:hypothetical protein [Luteibacter aegosomaticola]UPG88310.1 hypothetical protein L2Y96_12855 [Luteibacter aegosomaticola]
MAKPFPVKSEFIRIAANLVFWLTLAAGVWGAWAAGWVTLSTEFPDWFSSFLEAVLDVNAIGFVIAVSLLLFCAFRPFRRTRPLARAIADEISRVLYAAGTYALVSGGALEIAGMANRSDVLHVAAVTVFCLPLGFGWARLVHGATG